MTLPHQSIGARFGVERSSSFMYAQTVPNRPTGTLIRKTSRQSIGARMPPSTSPTNIPLTPTMLLIPSAIPRWWTGNASVMIAAALASRHAPPTPCTIRHTIRYVAPAVAGEPVDRQEQRRHGVDDEAEVVDLHAPVHVAEPAERDDQHAGHDQVAEDHPQQVEGVLGPQRVEVDAAEDVRHRDQRDRRVQRRQQDGERGVREGDPLVLHSPKYTGNLYSLPVHQDENIGELAAELRVALGQIFRRVRAEHGFPMGQGAALGALDREGPQSISDLAAGAKMRPQSMAQTVKELEESGYVERRPDPHDGRRSIVELTPQGLERLQADRRRRDGWLARTLDEELTARGAGRRSPPQRRSCAGSRITNPSRGRAFAAGSTSCGDGAHPGHRRRARSRPRAAHATGAGGP